MGEICKFGNGGELKGPATVPNSVALLLGFQKPLVDAD